MKLLTLVISGHSSQPRRAGDYNDTLQYPEKELLETRCKVVKELRQFSHANLDSGPLKQEKVYEALHLSEKEKQIIISNFKKIEEELNSRIDDFSHDVIISQIELLLNYTNRFYKRQFITRKTLSNDLLQKLEEILDDYFNNDRSVSHGILTVHHLSEQLNISPSYLSDRLRSLTGQSEHQHIHHKLIEKAKEKLSTANLTVSEFAYELGFEHAQSFSKLFKTRTKFSPLQFRASFN